MSVRLFFLLFFGAITALAQEGEKALIVSAAAGDLDKIDSLLEAGADVDHTGLWNLTGLQMAQMKGRQEAVELLLEKGATVKDFPPLGDFLDGVYDQAFKETGPGSVILVKQGENVLANRSYGYANVDKEKLNDPDTRFRIGSITKQFTAAAVLLLAEEGKIEIDATLDNYIPDFPRGSEVKIYHLLNHTSGIHSFTDDIEWTNKEITEPVTISEMVSRIKSFEYDFDPGERYSYNNSGYFLLSYLIEELSGVSYEQFLNERLWKPSGMNNTGVYVNDDPPEKEALGYSVYGNGYNRAVDWDMSWAGGAGWLYSTADDLILWNKALYSGKVVSKNSLEVMLTPGRLNDGSEIENKYGFGIMTGTQRGVLYHGHSGGLPGFNCYLNYFPDYDISIAVLTNSLPLPTFMDPARNAMRISEFVLWQEMEGQRSFRKSEAEPLEDAEVYTGRYEYPGGLVGTFTLENGQFYAQLTGQPKAKLMFEGADKFSWTNVDASITFVKDENGDVAYGLHNQNGAELKVNRIHEVPTLQVDAGILDKYAGTYTMSNGMSFVVKNENGQLTAQLGPQPAYPVFPKSDTTFFYKVVVAELEFKMGEGDRAESVILQQGGRVIVMTRK